MILGAGNRKVLSFLLFILLFLSYGVARAAEETTAVLCDFEGEVYIRRAGKESYYRPELGMEMRRNDKVVTGEASRATLYYFSGRIRTISKKTTCEVGTGTLPLNPDAFPIRVFEEPTRSFSVIRRREFVRDAILSGVKGNKKASFYLLAPSLTILTTHPVFQWKTVKHIGEDIFIVLEDDKSRILWNFEVTGKETIQYPTNKDSLYDGDLYYWYIRPKSLSRNNVKNLRSFNLASSKLRNEITTLRMNLENWNCSESTKLFIVGNFYKTRDLYLPAIGTFEKLAKLHPGEELPFQELLLIYYSLGDSEGFKKMKMRLEQLK